MTDAERRLARALSGCSMLPGCFEKRFVHELLEHDQIDCVEPLTVRQSHALQRAGWKFRRQLPAELAPRRDPGRTAPGDRARIIRKKSG